MKNMAIKKEDSVSQHFYPQRVKRLPLGQVLLQKGLITEDQLIVALKEQQRQGGYLGELLVKLKFLCADALQLSLSELSGYPVCDLKNRILDRVSIQKIPLSLALKHRLILLEESLTTIKLAMADPTDVIGIDAVRMSLGFKGEILPHHCDVNQVLGGLDFYYSEKKQSLTPHSSSGENNVVELVHEILVKAVRLNVSDVHFQPDHSMIFVKYRLDGVLGVSQTLHKEVWQSISVRLKIMGGMDIAEFRRPQTGRFSLVIAGREVDFRVSIHPTLHGENIVVRVLDKSKSLLSIEELGFTPQDQEKLNGLAQMPQGMIIISGPTGAGKTTTLYSLLSHIDTTTRNVMTLEEPVEYQVSGIRQTEIRDSKVLGFAEGIRSLLRQDPDVIFVSEIRDAETAKMALRASMTGHLVLATVHANDSFSAIDRLVDLGLSPSLLLNNLICSIAQRLVRKLCLSCRQPQISPLEFQSMGCEICHQTGYKGRVALAEILLITPSVRQMILEGKNLSLLLEKAGKEGFRTLRQRGEEKGKAGITTTAELNRVLGCEMERLL